MTSQLTPEQCAKLADLAKGVKGSFATLPLTDVLNRIHLITDYPYDRCVKGLRMMLSEELIAATFIPDLHRLDALSRVVDKTMPIIEATGSELVAVKEHVSDGPTDESDEDARQTHPLNVLEPKVYEAPKLEVSPRVQLDLSHINSNF